MIEYLSQKSDGKTGGRLRPPRYNNGCGAISRYLTAVPYGGFPFVHEANQCQDGSLVKIVDPSELENYRALIRKFDELIGR